MRVLLLAASNRQPVWVNEGFNEYAKRFRANCRLELKQIALASRPASAPVQRAMNDEGTRMLAAVPGTAHVVALAQDGEPWSTAQLVTRFNRWMTDGLHLCLLLGGPDGLSERCMQRADECWSLSRLTLPHGLARIVVAEALYRAWSVIQRHPYHRA